jgi:predicted phage baseplate assembly protein
VTTPLPLDNPPRRDTISYRAGRYGDFRAAMLARLSDSSAPFAPLLALRTRAADDPTIALIDAFAAVCEVLTFYQERLANEGYLGTATEPRSLIELARLTDYRPKGGLASSVFLAFSADPAASLTLPAGARAQSVPPPGQTAQSFETSEDLVIQGAWNAMKPRLSRPTQAAADLGQLFLDGTATGLKPNDPLLLVVDGVPTLRRVDMVTVQADRKRTIVALQPLASSDGTGGGAASNNVGSNNEVAGVPPGVAHSGSATAPASSTGDSSGTTGSAPPPLAPPTSGGERRAPSSLIDLVHDLATKAAMPPASYPPDSRRLERTSRSLLVETSDAAVALAAGASSADRSRVYKALAVTLLAPPAKLEVHAFRSVTAPSGARAPQRTIDANGRLSVPPQEWTLTAETLGTAAPFTIAITMSKVEAGSPLAVAIRSVTADPAERDGLRVASTITYANSSLDLIVDARPGASIAGTLASLGTVSCTVRQFDHTGLVLLYEFAGQPVTLMVAVDSHGQATVANQIASDAVTALAIADNLREARIEVSGMLAPQIAGSAIEQSNVLYLDGVFDTITPGSWVAFDAPKVRNQPALPAPAQVAVQGVATVSRVAYGQTAKVTRLELNTPWIDPKTATFERAIRETAVFADSVRLTLVDEDIVEPVAQAISSPTIELDGFVPGLASGRWLIVTGERVDLPGSVSGELVMLARADHQGTTAAASPATTSGSPPYQPGETVHTVLTFAAPLSFTYKIETMTIFGNVAHATQGESVDEILGSGSGVQANQSFALKKPPLTNLTTATPGGSASTLRIYVNGLQWREVASLGAQGPADRVFVTRLADGGGVTVYFGDGMHGARLPTGVDNVRARYRSGLGSSGNVDAGTITTLLARPLGLKSVSNPLAATGGADAESTDEMRRTVPIGLVSLSRLVTVRDYEDFALNTAGIGKASARRFAGPDGPLVHVTIAGSNDDTLDPTSDLWASLEKALNDYGDGEHEVLLAARTAKLALVNANVAIDSDRLWSDVEPVIRARLLDAFNFRRRRLGRSIDPSDVIVQIQRTPGVAYVDLRLLTAVTAPADESALAAALQVGRTDVVTGRPAHVESGNGVRRIVPAELVYLTDVLPDMLVLNEVPT